MQRFSSLAVIACIALMLLAFASPAAAQSSTTVVSISKGAGAGQSAAPGYNPATLTVVVGVNNTVVWENNDSAPHTVTPGNVPAGATWAVGSGDMPAGKTYSFTFTVPGTYTYSCAYHGWMSGTVVVKSASPVTTTTGSTTTTSSTTTVTSPTSSTTLSSTKTSSVATTSTSTSSTPEFPFSSLALTFFAVAAAAALMLPRLGVKPTPVAG